MKEQLKNSCLIISLFSVVIGSGCITASYDVTEKSEEDTRRTNFRVESVYVSSDCTIVNPLSCKAKIMSALTQLESKQNGSLPPVSYEVFVRQLSSTEKSQTPYEITIIDGSGESSVVRGRDSKSPDDESVQKRLAEAAFNSLTVSRYNATVAKMRSNAKDRLIRGEHLSKQDERFLQGLGDSLLVYWAKHPEDVNKSREALQKINDVDDLVDIALHASLSRIREEAAGRVSELPEDRFASLVKKTTDSSVGQIFLKKVSDDNLLRGIVEDSSAQMTLRTSSLERIKDESILANIARTSTDALSLQLSAVERIHAESILANVAKNAARSEVRFAAIGRIDNAKTLHKIVLTDSSAENRLAALARIDDPAILAKIVQESQNAARSEVRFAAIGRIDNAKTLHKIVLTDSSAENRLAALARIDDPAILAKIVQESHDVQIRLEVAGRINNQKVLNALAMNDEDESVRLSVLPRVKDKKTLESIAEHDSSERVRADAIKRIKNPEVLGRISKTDPNPEIRLAAFARVDDPDVIRSVAKEDASPSMRIAAIKKMEEDEMLGQIVLEDSDAEVRHEAIARISNGDVLSSVVLNDAESENREAAFLRISDQANLCRIAKESIDAQFRLRAVHSISDQGVLSAVAKNDSDSEVRVAALVKVHDQAVARALADSDVSESVRAAAVAKLDDDGFLETVYKTDSSAVVRKAALSKLSPPAKRRLTELIKTKSKQHNGIVLAGFYLGMDDEEASVLFETTFPNNWFADSFELMGGRVFRIKMSPEMIQSLSGGVLGVDDIPQATLKFLNVDRLRSDHFDCEVDGECVARENRYVCDSVSGEHLIVHMGGEKYGDWYIKNLEREWITMDEKFKKNMWNIGQKSYEDTPDHVLSSEGLEDKREFLKSKRKWRDAITRRDSFLAGLPPVGTVELTR